MCCRGASCAPLRFCELTMWVGSRRLGRHFIEYGRTGAHPRGQLGVFFPGSLPNLSDSRVRPTKENASRLPDGRVDQDSSGEVFKIGTHLAAPLGLRGLKGFHHVLEQPRASLRVPLGAGICLEGLKTGGLQTGEQPVRLTGVCHAAAPGHPRWCVADDRTGEDLAGSVFLCSTSTPGQEPERGAPSAAVRCCPQMCRYIQVKRENSEPEMGFEPMTCALRVRCSTTELPGRLWMPMPGRLNGAPALAWSS